MCDACSVVTTFLDNGTVAAFAGAFFAFLLVASTDYRRKRRKRLLLCELLGVSQKSIIPMQESLVRNKVALSKHDTLRPGPIKCLGVADIQQLRLDVLDMLSEKEKLCLDAILYHMSSINDLFITANDLTQRIGIAARMGNVDKAVLVDKERLLGTYDDLLANLERLSSFLGGYLSSSYDTILGSQRNREEELNKAISRFPNET